MSEFYQLTDSILIEYISYDEFEDKKLAIEYPDIEGNFLQETSLCIVEDLYNKNKYVFSNDYQVSFDEMTTNVCKTNTILSVTANGSRFVNPQFNDEEIPYTDVDNKLSLRILPYTEKIYYDTVILRFTRSGLDFNQYKSYIIEVMNTIGYSQNTILASVLLNADTKYILDSQPEIINGKLYVKRIPIRIPSIKNTSESYIKSIFDYDVANSYNKISIVGISSIIDENTFTFYNTEYIKSVNAIINTDTDISLDIKESAEGEFFEISTIVNDGEQELSDYFRGKNDNFQIEYQIRLIEHYLDEDITNYDVYAKETDRKYIMREYDIALSDEYQECNELILYRPVLKKYNVISFDIEVKMTITSISDNNSKVYTSAISYGTEESEYVSSYGKRIKPYISDSSNLLKVNVYNKRQKSDEMMPILQNTAVTSINKKATNVEVTSFIEAINIKVAVSDVSVSDITIEE